MWTVLFSETFVILFNRFTVQTLSITSLGSKVHMKGRCTSQIKISQHTDQLAYKKNELTRSKAPYTP